MCSMTDTALLRNYSLIYICVLPLKSLALSEQRVILESKSGVLSRKAGNDVLLILTQLLSSHLLKCIVGSVSEIKVDKM